MKSGRQWENIIGQTEYELRVKIWGKLSKVSLFDFISVSLRLGEKDVPSSGFTKGTFHMRVFFFFF